MIYSCAACVKPKTRSGKGCERPASALGEMKGWDDLSHGTVVDVSLTQQHEGLAMGVLCLPGCGPTPRVGRVGNIVGLLLRLLPSASTAIPYFGEAPRHAAPVH